MKMRAAVLNRMGIERPYAASKPLSIERSSSIRRARVRCWSGSRPPASATPTCRPSTATGRGRCRWCSATRRRAVVELGPGVNDLDVGDHVILVFVPSCGHCVPCPEGRPALCEPGAKANGAGTLLSGAPRLQRDGQTVYHHIGVSAFAEYAVVSRAIAGQDRRDAAVRGGRAVRLRRHHRRRRRHQHGQGAAGRDGRGRRARRRRPDRRAGRAAVRLPRHRRHRHARRQAGAGQSSSAPRTPSTPRDPDAVEQVRDLTRRRRLRLRDGGLGKALELAYKITRRGGTTVTASLPHPRTSAAAG